MSTDDGPRLVVIGEGPLQGQEISLREGIQVIGRGSTSDVTVPDPELSREHALVQWDGRTATIADAGSTNGTAINGERVTGRRPLRRGDVVRLGGLQLRFDDARREDTRPMAAARLDNRIGRDNYGQIIQAGGNVDYDEWNIENRLHVDDPIDELFTGRGPGRVLMVLGLIVALAGFAGWMSLIFSGFSVDDPTGPTPFDKELFGVPAFAVAFAAFALGGVIASIGRGMSRAARSREEEARRAAGTRLRTRH